MPLLHDLRQRRDERRATIDQILTRAAQEERDLTADEARDHQAAVTELRDLDDRVEELLSDLRRHTDVVDHGTAQNPIDSTDEDGDPR